ncbi:MAG: Nicotinamidase/isochorismatase family protein, partial [Friedmanniella sp.]|nr:Nicotinamidase/isochorismatase family protein [Friedmanniella sp.]
GTIRPERPLPQYAHPDIRTRAAQHPRPEPALVGVVIGVAARLGVDYAARSAQVAGFHVVIAIDAMTDLDRDTHRHSVERLFPRVGRRRDDRRVLARLDRTR